MVFLIYDFGVNSGIAGLFYKYDLVDEEKTINKGKYMYINISATSNTDNLVATMLHEFQHLINFSVNLVNGGKSMDLWLNEALSESTSVLFCPTRYDDRKQFFNTIPYYSFYSWYIDRIVSNIPSILFSYSSSSVFMKWILDKGGRETIKTIAHSSPSLDTRTRLVNSVKGLNIGNSVEEIFVSWIKDIYKGSISGVTVHAIPFDPNNKSINSTWSRIPFGTWSIYYLS